MQHDFPKIELAFDSVSSQMPSMCTAYLCRNSGKIFYLDDATGIYDELPDDFETSDDYIEIPHKNELDLGSDLAFDFTRAHAPNLLDDVREVFSRKGAYRGFKSLLSRNGLLENWFNYEQAEIEAALKQWCKDNAIELKPDEP